MLRSLVRASRVLSFIPQTQSPDRGQCPISLWLCSTSSRLHHGWRCMLGSLSVVPPALPKSGFPPEGHSNTCSLKAGTPSPPGWLGVKQGHEVWVLRVPASLPPHVLAVAARSHPCCPRGWDGGERAALHRGSPHVPRANPGTLSALGYRACLQRSWFSGDLLGAPARSPRKAAAVLSSHPEGEFRYGGETFC